MAKARTQLGIALALAAGFALHGAATLAAPFVPADDAQALERLPEKASPQLRQLKALRATVARDPQDLVQVAMLARRYIEAARSEGDPRYLGYAQAALKPWWNEPDAPTAAMVLRATIRQSNHDFDRAVADLNRVLAREPRNGQARLTRATVLTVQGRYADARADCRDLGGAAPPIYVTICGAAIDSLTGKASEAVTAVTAALSGPGVDGSAREWAETLLGEIAHRRGDAGAELHFRNALARDAKDPYLIGAYSDFLLDQGRPQDVLPLIAPDTRIDPLLLRLALAQKALQRPEAQATLQSLRARIDASRARGDTVHQREESRYALALAGDRAGALELALKNFEIQKEPADVRALAEAAHATGDAAALATVGKWMAETGLEYVALKQLLAGAPAAGTPR